MKQQHIPVHLIQRGPNDRVRFNMQKLQGLASSIHKDGLIQRPTLRQLDNGMYEIVAGERRVRAMRDILGWEEIPANVCRMSDRVASAIMLAENLSREDLNPMEESDALATRQDLYGWDEHQLAESAGISKVRVRSRLRLQSLSDHIQDQVRAGLMPANYAEKMCDLDSNRQYFALQVWKKNPRQPMSVWVEVIRQFYNDQKSETQEDFFSLVESQSDLVDMMCSRTVKGRLAITGFGACHKTIAPTSPHGKTAQEICMEYVSRLNNEGRHFAAGAVSTFFNELVSQNHLSIDNKPSVNGNSQVVGDSLDKARRKRNLLLKLSDMAENINGLSL